VVWPHREMNDLKTTSFLTKKKIKEAAKKTKNFLGIRRQLLTN